MTVQPLRPVHALGTSPYTGEAFPQAAVKVLVDTLKVPLTFSPV